MLKTYRKRSPYNDLNPSVVCLPDNEFDLYLAEHPELRPEAERWNWNINNRYDHVKPVTKQEWDKLYAESAEYIRRSAEPRPWKNYLHRELLLHCLLPEMKGSVLDFGCGAGNDGLFYASIGMPVTFSDVEGIGLDFIRWRLARRGIKGCHVLPSDQLAGKFDLALAIDCFEHILNAEEYFAKIHELLSPKGYLFISFNSTGEGMDVFSMKDFATKIQPILSVNYDRLEEGLYKKK